MSPWVLLSDETIENADYCRDILEELYGQEFEIPGVIRIIVEDWVEMVEGMEEQ